MDYSTKIIIDILHAADTQDVLTIQRFAQAATRTVTYAQLRGS